MIKRILPLIMAISMLTICLSTHPVEAQAYSQKLIEYSTTLRIDGWGKLTVVFSIYKLMNDGVSGYSWYLYSIFMEQVPGPIAYGTEALNDLSRITFLCHNHVWGDMVDHGPGTTQGTVGETTTYSVQMMISPQGPAGGGGWSYSETYSISDVVVRDQSDSDPDVDRVAWEHDIDEQMNPAPDTAKNTYIAKPAFVVKIMADDGPCYVDAQYYVRFNDPPALWKYRTWWVSKDSSTGWFSLDYPEGQRKFYQPGTYCEEVPIDKLSLIAPYVASTLMVCVGFVVASRKFGKRKRS